MKLKELPRPSSTYIRVKCRDCGAEALIYSHVGSVVKCKVCGAVLAEPTGGKARILGEIVKEPSGAS